MSDKTEKAPVRDASSEKPRVCGSANGATTTPTVKPGGSDSSDPLNVKKQG